MIPGFRRPPGGNRVAFAFSERHLVLARDRDSARSLPLPEGLLKASAVSANFSAVAEVGKLALALLEGGEEPSEVGLVLPDLSVTTMVVPSAGRLRRRELVERMAARLPFPASEARVDFWPGGCGEVLGAAIRVAVAEQYEELAGAVGARPGWMDAASLLAIPRLARDAKRRAGVDPGDAGAATATATGDSLTLEIRLFESHYSIVALRGSELVDLRFKLRPPGDIASVALEAARLPARYDGRVSALSIVGVGASALARTLAEAHALELGLISDEELAEDELLRRAAATLMARRV